MAQVQPRTSPHTDLGDARFRDLYQGIDKDSMAYKLLASMGWKEGEGLGAKKQGISVHVKAQKKFDTAGVGLKEASVRAQDWTLEMCKFSGILKGLQEVVNTAVASDDGDDGDQPVKTKKSKKRKKPSTAAETPGDHTDPVGRKQGNGCSAADDAHKAASTKLSAHASRYAKRARNKLVKGYSQTDLAAILGQTAPASGDMPAIAEISKQPDGVQAPRQAETAERPLSTRPDVRTVEPPVASATLDTAAAKLNDVTVAEVEQGWWGSIFARGARMGTSGSGWEAEKAFGKKNGFSEQDQTDLYNNAQDGKTQGKQGLGVGSRPGQLKKRAWKGKKMTFESDGEESAEDQVDKVEAAPAQEPESQDPHSDMLPGGAVIVWSKGVRPQWFQQRRAELQTAGGHGDEGEPVDPASDDKAIPAQAASIKLTDKQRQKCLRVAAKMLQKGSGGVKLATAVDKAMAALRLDPQPDLQRLRKKVKSVLKKGDDWSIENGMIVPAACA